MQDDDLRARLAELTVRLRVQRAQLVELRRTRLDAHARAQDTCRRTRAVLEQVRAR